MTDKNHSYSPEWIKDAISRNWLQDNGEIIEYDASLVKLVYKMYFSKRMMLNDLDSTFYLTKYLLPHLSYNVCIEHIMSVAELCLLIGNLRLLQTNTASILYEKVFFLLADKDTPVPCHFKLLEFLIISYESLEVDAVRVECLKYTSIGIWTNLTPSKLSGEFKRNHPKVEKYYQFLKKKYHDAPEDEKQKINFQNSAIFTILNNFLLGLCQPEIDESLLEYLCILLRFFICLESQLPTRRYFHPCLENVSFIVCCRQSQIYLDKSPAKVNFVELVDLLDHYYRNFSIISDDYFASLQRIIFSKFPELINLAFCPVEYFSQESFLKGNLLKLDGSKLAEFADMLELKPKNHSTRFIIETIWDKLSAKPSLDEQLGYFPIYPTEKDILDKEIDTLVEEDDAAETKDLATSKSSLALPKLNLQFLSLTDYLWRNYNLFRLEAIHEIGSDIEDAVKRTAPVMSIHKTTEFTGWSRMAVAITSMHVYEIGKPGIGLDYPSFVKAELNFSIARYSSVIREEWDSLKPLDTIFLIKVVASISSSTEYKIEGIRGCQIHAVYDNDGNVIQASPDADEVVVGGILKGDKRRLVVLLDPQQYYSDTMAFGESFSNEFNLLVRRKSKENNFKGILETIKTIMKEQAAIPSWLEQVFLGYGDPKSVAPNLNDCELDMFDTFIDINHLRECTSFIEIINSAGDSSNQYFRLNFSQKGSVATLYQEPPISPYTAPDCNRNRIRFTPTQADAIRSGMTNGLTLIVGPPGTGKTDVCVQIISNLYHANKDQVTLIITHSNHALNQLFSKLFQTKIDQRHMLRMGYGEESLESDSNYTQYGRVSHLLERKFHLLQIVDRLAKSLNITGDYGYTCETALIFFKKYIATRWEQYTSLCQSGFAPSEYFPFHVFFSDAPQPLFLQNDEKDMEKAIQCYHYLEAIFKELEEIRPFEILKNNNERANYLLIKEAKVVAMTCTYAALKRQEMVKIGFKFDTLLIEEAGQILEIESFIPMVCQMKNDTLKRIVMVGDHNQLPPVVQDHSLVKNANLNQSCFSRLIRLGVPYIQLDRQGRCRSELADIFRWKYTDATSSLGDLPHVSKGDYSLANTGLAHEYQFINVPDFAGQGESAPLPHYFQNVAEAEYAIAIYQYLIFIGYPSSKITILATYNGQVALMKDVFKRRASWNKFFKYPKISTVDKYQGQQNDIVILSLVRTSSIGYLKDIRRLVVAFSRSRLGLYVLGRTSLFYANPQLKRLFEKFKLKPNKLQLCLDERYPTSRKIGEDVACTTIEGVEQMGELVYEMSSILSKNSMDVEASNNMEAEESGSESEDSVDESEHPIDSKEIQQ